MISNSTKKKWRYNKARIVKRMSIRLELIDKRCDFWLVSQPTTPVVTHIFKHDEVRGKDKALKLLRVLVSNL